jgi:hypothetical protein
MKNDGSGYPAISSQRKEEVLKVHIDMKRSGTLMSAH